MKKISFLILLSTLAFCSYSQDSKTSDEQQIKNVINQFFESLEKKDSLLMRQTTMDEAQIWRRNNVKNPAEFNFRFSKDDLPTMHTWPDVKEIAKDFDINIHNGIAAAWVPYEFWIEDNFSHCGVDVFSLFKIDGNWKIISAAYTVDKENCDR